MAKEHLIPGPDHPISIEPVGERIVARVGGEVLADTTAALGLHESTYPVVTYIPLADIDQTKLRHTETATYCPYKGDCSYYTVITPTGELVDAGWTYEHPYPAVDAIAGHVAFYPDRVALTSN
jgi:uncharacterized protein (DUF427 family)